MARLIPAFTREYDEALLSRIMERHGVSRLLSRALIRRNLTREAEIEAFLHPEQQTLSDPYLYPDMGKAVERIRLSVLSDERIVVYGDYDADGVCAVSILYRCLSELTEYVSYYIPSRHADGYGLNRAAIDLLADAGTKLLITVDNGVTANDEIAYCRARGVDVVVTDHHLPKGPLPDCAAVLSGAAMDSAPCGAFVALQLARALTPDADISDLLPLAAIATVADMVPLIGENRTAVKKGLPLIKNNLGVRALLTQADMLTKPVTETTVSFFIAPRLNAAGRVDDAKSAVELLLCEKLTDALTLADQLEEANRTRKSLENEMLRAAQPMLKSTLKAADRAVVIAGAGWNVGVVGIAASKLTEQTHLPALVFSEADGVLTGSGRSVPGVNLFDALSHCGEYFLRFGGHEMAAGVTMESAKLSAFREAFSGYIAGMYPPEMFEAAYCYEEELPLSEMTLENAEQLARLSPFGEGNREPMLLLTDVGVSNARAMGRDKSHLAFELVQAGQVRRAVFFGQGRLSGLLSLGGGYDVYASLYVNVFNGASNPELSVRYVWRHADADTKIVLAILENLLYNKKVFSDFDGLLSEEAVQAVRDAGGRFDRARMQRCYAAIRTCLAASETNARELIPLLNAECAAALFVFLELGFFAFDGARGVLSVAENFVPRELTESALYLRLTKE